MAICVQGPADTYLMNLTPLLETYCRTIQEITDQPLNLQLQEPVLRVEISYENDFVKTKSFDTSRTRPSFHCTSTTQALSMLEIAVIYSEKLANVLEKYFKFQSDSNSSDLSKKIKKLKELSDGINSFLELIERIIDHYDLMSVGYFVSVEALPSLNDLKNQKEQVCSMKKRLKIAELHQIFSEYKDDFIVSDASILCSLLSLNKDYENFLDTLKAEKEEHHDNFSFILMRLIALERDMEYDRTDKGYVGLCNNLISLGFNQTRAEAIAKNIPPELIDLQMPSYWAERYLKNVFMHHPLLFNNSRYPYSENRKDQWFEEEISTEKRDEPNENILSFQIKMLNCTCGNKKLVDYLKNVKDEDEDSLLLFHGTTHADAQSILTSGIILSAGKKGQDFSSGDGFYLTEKLQDADKWSEAARGEHKAVLVFKVPKELLDPSKEHGLDLTGDQEMWQSVVKLCRNHYNDKKAKARLLKDVSFIRGYTCLNPIDFAQGKSNAEGFGQSEIQIVIRDEDYSVKFASLENICCVIFY
uniref:PARP catalytic domain-containing protein n=1 Tax=Biomphalaria glabrata TaxID=6526 RepID=A0A2C9LX44_BIOGL